MSCTEYALLEIMQDDQLCSDRFRYWTFAVNVHFRLS